MGGGGGGGGESRLGGEGEVKGVTSYGIQIKTHVRIKHPPKKTTSTKQKFNDISDFT